MKPGIKSFVERILGGSPFEIGDRVLAEDNRRIVEITGGQYWGTHGLSNFWYWREVNDDGTLSDKEENGYGWEPDIDLSAFQHHETCSANYPEKAATGEAPQTLMVMELAEKTGLSDRYVDPVVICVDCGAHKGLDHEVWIE